MKKTVSILLVCTLLASIGAVSVFAVPTNTYTGQLFYTYQDVYDSSGNNRLAQVLYELSASDPYIVEMDTDREIKQWNTTSTGVGGYLVYQWDESSDIVYASDITVYARIANQTDEIISLNRRYFRLQINVAQMYKSDNHTQSVLYNPPWSMGSAYGCYVLPERQYFYLFMEDQYITDNRLVLTPGQTLTCTFNFTVYKIVQRSDDLISDWLSTYYIGIPGVNYETALQARLDPDIATYNPYYNIYSILDAYKQNVHNAEAVTDGTATNDQTLSTIGTNEDTWFTQNNQALQATGITNFDYSPTVTSGMNVINEQFLRLWAALGDWNFVYTFSMMLGLVVLILRHNPQRKKATSSGSGGGGKSANSS